MRILVSVVFLVLATIGSGFAQSGHDIKIKINGYEQSELYLAYHLGDKQYISDTVKVESDGTFRFKGDKPMEGGVYLVVMAPDNNFFQILVDDKNQNFSVVTAKDDPASNIKFTGSEDNSLFYEYLAYINARRPEAERLGKAIATAAGADKENLLKEQEQLNTNVVDYQRKLVADHPTTLTAAIIKANLPFDTPDFEGTEDEVQMQRWRYTQKHYFDNINLGDARMLRTPFLFQRVDYFINKLQVQHPDTMALAVDYVLERMKPAEETFKFFLVHYLNEYAKSKIVGMDAAYVHLVDNYYRTGKASWTDEESLKKIIESADKLKPLLIGKIAPDIEMRKKDGSKVRLHEVDSDYTILYFWRYDCGHCKESTPHMKAFYEKFKDKGVKLFAVCTKFTDEVEGCWEYIDENGIQDWLHTVDPYHQSRFSKLYDIRSTPQVYVLDNKKEIISKRIGADQLEELMNRILEQKANEGVGSDE
ncbi:MAG: redoxin domain-containing protein [Cyanothece sp. SIO1E1]|nr:redoxin domain-containing protein [Cyanothece sp. SIO1E1]